MIDPIETLDAGGTGLGCDEDTKEHRIQQAFVESLRENHRLRLTILEMHRSNQWRTLGMAITFIAGFLLCAALLWVTE